MVDFARDQGFEFDEANDNIIKTELHFKSGLSRDGVITKEYKIHKKIPFTSSRARMSLLFTDPDDGLTKLYIKGADTKIKERLDKKQTDDKVLDHINDFLSRAAVTGLRTLLLAMKVIHKDELRDILNEMAEAEKNVKTRDENLQKIYEKFEQNVVLIGAT